MAAQSPSLSADYRAEDRGPLVTTVICSVGGVMTLFVLARLYVRGILMRKLFADDYFIIISMISSWVAIGMSVEGAKWGNGRHFDGLTLEEKSNAILLVSASFIPAIMSFAVPKFAVVALLCRLLNPARWHRILLWCLSSLVLVIIIIGPLLHFTTCKPARALWDFTVKNPVCRAPDLIVKWSFFSASCSALMDLYLAVYPSTVLYSLQITRLKKLALCVALGFGSASTGVAIYKTTRLNSLASPDVTFDTADLVIWTICEGSTLIIAACIPVLQPLVDVLSGKRVQYDQSSGYKRYGGSSDGKSASSSSHRHNPELESGTATTHSGRSRLRPQNPDDDLLRTVEDKAVDSQESILPEKTRHADNITRTDEVKVEYDHDTTGMPKKGQWRGFQNL
ncbi:hypothetical protein B0T26DRAFT_651128 [Lasiosphaeria miniovina]|uniref:Rhodopsin domain-containing protein n=1 Tax=Lasiosphaeria miniovina TaxID=1954250 RepID=A0AA40AD30_9PEZI|nr:uncharacterized protein B0T26DRAFT_651128 [Lasiosphaeria miniovina]KAK0713684.1 hypothetical protein B0T26DRAFT_651128 [Lasiosphaeria miniovina]